PFRLVPVELRNRLPADVPVGVALPAGRAVDTGGATGRAGYARWRSRAGEAGRRLPLLSSPNRGRSSVQRGFRRPEQGARRAEEMDENATATHEPGASA